MYKYASLLAAGILSLAMHSSAQTVKKPAEYLSVPGPIIFNATSYQLGWSAHPSPIYYKQEYLPKGDSVGHFKSMVIAEVVSGATSVKDAVAQKSAELKKMSQTNPLVKYESFYDAKKDECVLDFVVSANAEDGTPIIVERNVYRYKNFTDKKGKKGLLLFGIVTRAYDNAIDAFLADLKKTKATLVNQVSQYKLPEVLVK